MPIINQTASLTGVSNSYGMFVGMLIIGGVVIFVMWIATQFQQS